MDKKAKKILFQTFWSSKGWKSEQTIDLADFDYAKEKGLMFDPVTISHDDCVAKIADLVESIQSEKINQAFLSSLSARRLDWRSGISSYYLARLIPPHTYTPAVSGQGYRDGRIVVTTYTCGICRDVKYGVHGDKSYVNRDLNVLNFERIKWGGVRHGDLLYTLFDLEEFVKEDIPEPTSEDIEIFKNILDIITTCKADDYPSALEAKLKAIPNFKSNQDERATLIEILAAIGILKPARYDRPIRGKSDWVYAQYWRGEDGYDQATVEQFFGKYISPK